MAVDDKIRDEKLQYNIKRETEKISTLFSSKIVKYEYLTYVEMIPSEVKSSHMSFCSCALEKVIQLKIKVKNKSNVA